jgi:hypothetical protein
MICQGKELLIEMKLRGLLRSGSDKKPWEIPKSRKIEAEVRARVAYATSYYKVCSDH